MENLSLHDAGPPGQPGPQQMGQQQQQQPQQQQQTLGMPPPVPQLPPQMFTTAAQLLDLTDSECVDAMRVDNKR
jgi:U6 snRNA-associated Sm-like protein LSm1